MRHSFGVAEIAHVFILCLNETEMPGACVTGPARSGKGLRRPRYVHRPRRAQAAGRIHQRKIWPKGGLVSITCRVTRRALPMSNRVVGSDLTSSASAVIAEVS